MLHCCGCKEQDSQPAGTLHAHTVGGGGDKPEADPFVDEPIQGMPQQEQEPSPEAPAVAAPAPEPEAPAVPEPEASAVPAPAPEPEIPAVPAPEPEAANGAIFSAVLEPKYDEEPLGLKVDFADDKWFQICHITAAETTIARYNASTPEAKKVNIGDYLQVPDGPGGPDLLRQQLASSKSVTLLVSRPYLFTCLVEKKGQPLGLDVTYCSPGASLVIKDITAGAVQTSAPEIQVGDRVVGIGDVAGSPAALVQALCDTGESMLLKLSRPFAASQLV